MNTGFTPDVSEPGSVSEPEARGEPESVPEAEIEEELEEELIPEQPSGPLDAFVRLESSQDSYVGVVIGHRGKKSYVAAAKQGGHFNRAAFSMRLKGERVPLKLVSDTGIHGLQIYETKRLEIDRPRMKASSLLVDGEPLWVARSVSERGASFSRGKYEASTQKRDSHRQSLLVFVPDFAGDLEFAPVVTAAGHLAGFYLTKNPFQPGHGFVPAEILPELIAAAVIDGEVEVQRQDASWCWVSTSFDIHDPLRLARTIGFIAERKAPMIPQDEFHVPPIGRIVVEKEISRRGARVFASGRVPCGQGPLYFQPFVQGSGEYAFRKPFEVETDKHTSFRAAALRRSRFGSNTQSRGRYPPPPKKSKTCREGRNIKECRRGCERSGRTEDCFFYGRGMLKRKKGRKAVKALDWACVRGEGNSCYILGQVYEIGRFVPRDVEKANALIKKACDAGYCDVDGNQRTNSKNSGFEQASTGPVCGGRNVQRCFEDAVRKEKSFEYAEAAARYEELCNNFNVGPACHNISRLYGGIWGEGKNLKRKIFFVKRGCQIGFKPSCKMEKSLRALKLIKD